MVAHLTCLYNHVPRPSSPELATHLNLIITTFTGQGERGVWIGSVAVEMWSWLSSGAAWFVFLNVIVGAIAVMSWLGGHGAAATATGTPSSARRKQLERTASTVVMERLRSVANFPFQYLSGDYGVTPLHGEVSGTDCFYCPREAEEVVAQTTSVVAVQTAAPVKPEPPAPVRECLPETTTSMAMAPPSAPATAAAEAQAEAEPEEEDAEAEDSISLDEAYALAQQARAPRSAATSSPNPATAAAAGKKREPAKVTGAKPRRAREEVVEAKAEVNARADRFIQQFRADLKLQRINSIINYTNALRRRGGSAAPAPEPEPTR
ncbi:uncharacterized protein LOC102711286 [Oryza brachyantha]|uniref:uncharacterized protein LOC102711286 n=1 Tax=Oryza brachyantha TaxID=4533 RepID=UPI001AD9EB52|nr:uncharacterized protein LOC102711286 [Oryza brachyantha]